MPSTLVSLLVPLLSLAYMCAIPVSFLVYRELRFKEILAEVWTGALAVIKITEGKRELLATQNQLLEHQVEAPGAEKPWTVEKLTDNRKLPISIDHSRLPTWTAPVMQLTTKTLKV